MLKDAITTVSFALQSYVNTCIHEDTEENKEEREELIKAWAVVRKKLFKENV